MVIKTVKRNLFQRLFGKPATSEPENGDCWTYAEGRLTVSLHAAPELQHPGGAARFEGRDLPLRVLVVYGENGLYRAYHNKCTHIGQRRLDPVPGTDTVQCCSISKSTFDSGGGILQGPAAQPITTFPVEREGDKLIVLIDT